LRFLVDMPITPRAIAMLVELGHDAKHAVDVGLASAPDSEIIARARDENRVVITADLDYPRLLALSGANAPGVVLFRGGSYSDDEMLGLLGRVLGFAADLDLENSIVVVDRERVRRRRLPLVR
jgi:predicted nuclease of predicted toxin-antitoxin system